jgi:hypothetical protein
MTRTLCSRIEALEKKSAEANGNPYRSMSDAELQRESFKIFQVFFDVGGWSEVTVRHAETFFQDRLYGRNFAEYHKEEWQALDEICTEIERTAPDEVVQGIEERLRTLNHDEFMERAHELTEWMRESLR